MLRRDRVDVALYSKLTGYATISELGLSGVGHLDPPLASRDMYMYLHESNAELAADIATQLREIKADGTYEELLQDVLADYGLAVLIGDQ